MFSIQERLAIPTEPIAGAAQELVNQTWLTWYETNIHPFLVSKGYLGPPMPTGSATTVFEAE